MTASRSAVPTSCAEDTGIIAEYLGNQHHNRPERFGQDAARKTHLQGAGFTVIDVTRLQTASKRELDAIAALIRTRLGLAPLQQDAMFAKRDEKLRSELFDTPTA